MIWNYSTCGIKVGIIVVALEAFARGNVNEIVSPSLWFCFAAIVPPCRSTISWQKARPIGLLPFFHDSQPFFK